MTIAIPFAIIFCILAWMLRPKKRLNRTSRIAILTTMIPPVTISIVAIVFQIIYQSAGGEFVSAGANVLYFIGLGLVGIAVLTLISFAIKHKGDIAKNIGFSLCIVAVFYIIAFALLEMLGGL